MRDMNLRHQLARVEIARHENTTNAIVWNTECCICLSIAELECMRRQERAPDFASDTRVQFLRAVSHSSCSRYRCLWHWRRWWRRPRCQRQQSASVSLSCQCTSVAGYVRSLSHRPTWCPTCVCAVWASAILCVVRRPLRTTGAGTPSAGQRLPWFCVFTSLTVMTNNHLMMLTFSY